jgi:hypothetical protein
MISTISTVQTFQINSKTIRIDLAQVPEISEASRRLLAILRDEGLPSAICTAAPLKKRISALAETERMLQEATDKNFRNKLFAVLKTALVVVLIYEAVAFSVDGGTLAVLGGAGPAEVLYCFLTCYLYHKAKKKITRIEERLPNYSPQWCFKYDVIVPIVAPVLGGGLVLPLYEAITKKARLEKVLERQKEILNAEFSSYKEHNIELLPLAYRFYRTHSFHLLKELDLVIDKFTKKLVEMVNLPNKSAARENDLRFQLADYHMAREELIAVMRFYNQIERDAENKSMPEIDVEEPRDAGEGESLSSPLLTEPRV